MELTDNSIYNYAFLLRSIFCSIEHRYQQRRKKSSQVSESEVFKIDPNYTAETFLCGIFLLEDTSDATDNYNKFGLDGPTKYENIGEKYLRLYGILNAAYMQFITCHEFYRMFKVSGHKKFKKESEELQVLKLRHTAASHSVNYKSNGVKDFYKISQMTLKGYGEKLHVIGQKDDQYEFDLKRELDCFTQFLNSHLSKISSTLISRYFNKNSTHYKDYMADLELIDAHAIGALIIDGAHGIKQIVFPSLDEHIPEELLNSFDEEVPSKENDK